MAIYNIVDFPIKKWWIFSRQSKALDNDSGVRFLITFRIIQQGDTTSIYVFRRESVELLSGKAAEDTDGTVPEVKAEVGRLLLVWKVGLRCYAHNMGGFLKWGYPQMDGS